MKVAALDLGSNTFLCLVAEIEKIGNQISITNTYSDSAEVVRLGQGLDKEKKFHPDALIRADECLEKFSKILQEQKPEKVLAMATSAARDATNKEELFALLAKYEIPLEIIAGEKEASITYQGAVSGFASTNEDLLVVDIGGGSTEFIFGHDQKLLNGTSRNIGCVRLTEKFIESQPTPQAEVEKALAFIDLHLAEVMMSRPNDFNLSQVIAVAGTPTSLVAAELGQFDAQKIDGYILSLSKLEGWLGKLSKATVQEKIDMGIPKGRADVILIGVLILLRTLKFLNVDKLTVSTRGVRYGVALELGRRYLSGS